MIIWGGVTTQQRSEVLDWKYSSVALANGANVVLPTLSILIYTTTPLKSGGRFNPETGKWTRMTMQNAPEGRVQHVAVWTGQEMLVWGGVTRQFPDRGAYVGIMEGGREALENLKAAMKASEFVGVDFKDGWEGKMIAQMRKVKTKRKDPPPELLSSGAIYDPTTDRWQPISGVNAPGARLGHTAVWSGRELLLWGGMGDSFDPNQGYRYDPRTDRWSRMSSHGEPQARHGHSAVWTGKEMIVWGGDPQLWKYDSPEESYVKQSLQAVPSGGRYDPETDRWTATPTTWTPPKF